MPTLLNSDYGAGMRNRRASNPRFDRGYLGTENAVQAPMADEGGREFH
jgi:hypothetical protein